MAAQQRKPTAENKAGYSEVTVIVSYLPSTIRGGDISCISSPVAVCWKSLNEKKKQTVIIKRNGSLHRSTGALLIIWEGVYLPTYPRKQTMKMHNSD